MMKFLNVSFRSAGLSTLAAVALSVCSATAAASDLEALFEERIRSVVAVEYFVETEIERSPSSELGVVVDDEGLIVLLDFAIPNWVPVDQLKEFKVLPLRSSTKFDAEYLGQDPLTGWHFLRVADEEMHQLSRPVTTYATETPAMGQEVWGIAVMDDDFDYDPYFVSSRFSALRALPQKLGLTVSEVASPGSLIFSMEGALLGWAGISYAREVVLHMGDRRLPVALQGMRESGAFLPVDEFLPYLDRVPASPDNQKLPWLGITNLQPVERELAEFLDIVDRSGIILSEIVAGTAADEGGLAKGDIVIAINGEPIPYYRPRQAAAEHFQREILKREPGETIHLTLLRGTEEIEREVEVGLQPKTLREARRVYFPEVGLTAREFLVFDGIARRIDPKEEQGLIVQFVRPNGPAQTAGLSVGDWIQEVDGTAVSTYPEAIQLVAEAENGDRKETVFLISRQNETSVIRVRLR